MLLIRPNTLLNAALAVTFTLCSWSSGAQQYLDEKSFLTSTSTENIKEKLQDGYLAFFLHEATLSDEAIDAIEDFLESGKSPLILIFDRVNPIMISRLNRFIYTAPPGDTVFGPEFNNGQLYIFSYDGNFLNAAKYLKKPASGREHSTNNLTIFKDDPLVALHDLRQQLRNLYQNAGYLPNIFISDRPAKVRPIVDSINNNVYYHAIVLKDGVKLAQVSWDTTGLKSNGKIHTRVVRVRPYKRGYMFSPDVINFNNYNASSIKVFRAHKRRLHDALRLDMKFNKNPDNAANPDVSHRYANIDYVEDPERGWVGEFSGREKYIDFGNVLENVESEITVSVWVYPYDLSYNKSIVGMGESFSAKILNGNPVFTTPDIQDHINEASTIPEDSWTHIAFVYGKEPYVYFYVNGRLTNTQPASGIMPTSQSLIIGTNLWDEFFVGKMDDLRVWTRALSDDEVRLVFEEGVNVPADKVENQWLMIIAFLVLPLLFALWKYRSKKVPGQESVQMVTEVPVDPEDSYHIRLFDGFQLKNQSDENLSNQLSPQRKALFLLILIHTIRKGGIETREMTDTLWAGYSNESAKNNRSTQMVRLREILAKDTGITLIYEDKQWKMQWHLAVSCDLADYQAFKNEVPENRLDPRHLDRLLKILGSGKMLPHFESEWLDRFKGEINYEILEMLTPCFYCEQCLKNKQLMLKLIKAVTALDPLNEQALGYQLKLFLQQGKHALAKHTFESYRKTYFNFYNEPFSKSFTEYVAEAVQLRHG